MRRPLISHDCWMIYAISVLALLLLLVAGESDAVADDRESHSFEWQKASPASQGMDAAKLAALKNSLASRHTKAFLVIRNDRIVYEWYQEGHGPDKRHYTASMAKAIVGSLSLAVAMSDGLIALDDPAWKYVPQWKSDTRKSKIAIRHLGSHTSGLEDSSVEGFTHTEEPGWKGEFWKRSAPPHDPFTLSRDAAAVLFEPGESLQYSNPGIAMLTYCVTACLREAPHKDIRTLLRERIMRPIGAADGQWSVGYDRTYMVEGLPLVASWGGGGYTARAVARVGRLMLRQGDWQGRQLISAEAVGQVTRDVGTPGNCGIGWWNNNEGGFGELPKDAFWGSGAGHQVVFVVPSLNLIAVRNGSDLGTETEHHEALRVHLFAPLIKAVSSGRSQKTEDRRMVGWAGSLPGGTPYGATHAGSAQHGQPSCPSYDSDWENGFADPSGSARPAAYWVWVNGVTNQQQLTYELEQMKAKGLSGVYIFDVGAQDPDGIVPKGPAFMGPESLNAIGHAVREASRLGLEVGLVTSSSWNCGGPWVRPEHASMGLYQSATSVKGPAEFSQVLPFPSLPKQAPKNADGKPAYHKDVAVLAVPEARPGTATDTGSIINLTEHLDEQGRLSWSVPAGTWLICRFVCANTGAKLRLPSPASDGFAIDHFNAEATKAHFDYLIERLHQELGAFEDTALKQAYVCSYELSGSTWTPDFLQEFKKRRGYDMTAYLPVLFGSVVGSPEVTERFTYDYRKTLGDLLVDAFYKTARVESNRHGLLLCAEAGGPGPPLHQVPVDALKALGALDIPRGEFWKEHNVWVVKETACASHIYGKKIVDMESFTSWRHWQDGPFELKPIADRALCGGTNHFTFHTSAHNPPSTRSVENLTTNEHESTRKNRKSAIENRKSRQARSGSEGPGLPGWVYHAGTHISPSVVWWPMARPFIDYLSRCCYMLQQGLFVGDVCYYYGDQGFNFVPPKHVDPALGYGYDYDVTNAEVILTRMRTDGGRLVLPDGMSYELLVLPERDDIDLDVLKKLEVLVKAGATVVGRKPTKSNGLTEYPHRDEEVRELGDTLWGPCDSRKIKERRYGKGRILWGLSLREILQDRGIGPDFSFTGPRGDGAGLDYIHRRTSSADIYFVSNTSASRQDVECTFRVFDKAPELWDPGSGRIQEQLVYSSVEGGTKAPLRLPPAGSIFVVFRQKAKKSHIVSIAGDKERGTSTEREITGPWEVRFPPGWGAPASRVFPNLISWTQDCEEGVRYFSGIAAYHKDFELAEEQLEAGREVFLDLGRVRFVADVYLNGTNLGIVWKPPFRLDITRAARPGKNKLVIEVANTWSNRLTGDANSPRDQRFCRTNIAKSLTWKVPWKDTPLLESGLLGPVRLILATE